MSKFAFKIFLTFDAFKRSFLDSGWLRSILKSRIERQDGRSLPWLSYPAIHFLDSLDLSGAHVFEFGSGNSTLYWRDRMSSGEVRRYVGLEANWDYWSSMCRKDGFYRDNVTLRAGSVLSSYLYFAESQAFVAERPFDVTVVDGPLLTHRSQELEAAAKITDSTGFIVVDDAQWMGETLTEFCARHHFYRIDFAGHAPAVSYTKITSILFREPFWFTAPRLFTPTAGMESFPGMP